MRTVDNSLRTRSSLLSRVRKGEGEAWEKFYAIYHDYVYGVARKAGLTHEEAQDLVQETMLRVTKHVAAFVPDKNRAPFRGWLLTIVRSRVVDYYRRRRVRPEDQQLRPERCEEDSRHTATIDRIQDPNGADFQELWEKEWQQTVIEEATAHVKARTSIKHFQVFDLHQLQQVPVRQVATSLGISSAQVYLVAHRVKKAIVKEAKQLARALKEPGIQQ